MSSGCTVQHLPVREGQTSKHTMTKELKQQLYILVAPLKKTKTLNIYWSAPYLKGRTAPDVYGASIPPPVNVPQVLDFLPHHRNLLIQLIDVLAAAVTRRTHRVQEDTKDRHVSVGQLSARCWTQTNPTQISCGARSSMAEADVTLPVVECSTWLQTNHLSSVASCWFVTSPIMFNLKGNIIRKHYKELTRMNYAWILLKTLVELQ